ncbi:hypothetical protein CRG98_022319 [Punica granatum]|uniref:Uncharacterized protein n=1 Tax=Punica granatum TaxID=22663 RepID=A0A2I0JN05_PUNGR|nr:hypothetical protein CRG98_022319 [Punica granatum]
MRRWLCTVDRPPDRDHLFTREGEGYEEPFERDGTTRQSRGGNRHIVEVRGRGEGLSRWPREIEPWLGRSNRSRGFEPWLGVELWLDGSTWLSCGSHSIERKVGKRLRLD